MMRFHYAFSVLLGTVVVLPNAAPGAQDGSTGVSGAIAQTTRAIEALNELKLELEGGDLTAIERVLGATEAPILDDRKRDEFLVTLRREVSGLQMSVDVLLTDPSMTLPKTTRSNTAGPGTQPLQINSGLTPEMRTAIGTTPNAIDAFIPKQRGQRSQKQTLESPGFVADKLREGRLYYRSGRYQDAVKVLRSVTDSPQARYWEARSFEQLQQVPEALELYRALSEQTDDPSIAARAKSDLSFLSWKHDFEQSTAKDGSE